MIRARVDLELAAHCAAELRLGEHADNGLLDETIGGPVEDLTDSAGLQATRESGVVVSVLALQLVAADGNLLSVDDDNEVTTVDVRRVGGLVLATQQVRCLNGKTAEHHVSGVDDVPRVGHISGLRGVRRHRSSSS